MDSERHIDVSAHWDGCELDLACSLDGLRKLIDALRRNDLGIYKLKTEGVGAGRVDALELESRTGKLVLTIDSNKATLAGNLPSLQLLADNLDFLCNQWTSNNDQHLHLEPASNKILFSPESEALIVSPYVAE